MDTVTQKLTRAQPTFCQLLLASSLVPTEKIIAARALVGDNQDALADHLVREGLLTEFQIRQLRAGATGFFVDKYVVLDILGRGGNGLVFKARHSLPPQRLVALKTLDTRNLHGGDEALARFQREIEILTRLQHPNIVRAYEVIRTRSQIFLVLEFVDGQNLATLVRQRGPLPLAEAVGYTIQAARGLSYAHRCGVIHRDLKPANLLLTRDGKLKIADLGLARDQEQQVDSGLTMKGACLGTPEFMAPEQAEDATRSDGRSDLYSLGATLFHLLTGELPVSGNSYMQRLQRLLTQPPRSLAEVRADFPAELVAVVDQLRAQDPDARPSTADEVIGLLEPFTRQPVKIEQGPWTGQRKAALVLEVLQGKVSAAVACTRHQVAMQEFEHWRQRFLEGARHALDGAPAGGVGQDLLLGLQAKLAAQAKEIARLKRLLPGAT